MKILSYNINKSNQDKIDFILSKGMDIMVLPECASPEQIKLPEGYSMKWMGIRDWCDWKGLGVICSEGHDIIVAPWFNEVHKFILPLIVDNKYQLIATWPTKVPNEKQSYSQILFDALKDYQEQITRWPTVICGDYNCYIGMTSPRCKSGSWEQCIALLRECGLYSLYHEQNNEEFGKETRTTYYHLFKSNMPFFIDYVFTNIKNVSYELGEWDNEFSDHCPQMIEFCI